jgi:glycine cleavage system aminomethyltransferase T
MPASTVIHHEIRSRQKTGTLARGYSQAREDEHQAHDSRFRQQEELRAAMTDQNLEQALQTIGSPVELLRNSQTGPYAFPVVRAEFTNWRDEQRAWRETCALLDLSHHMTDLHIEGPDALKLLTDLGVNSFKNFNVNQAKQFVATKMGT